jgi:metallo-beta-lactamase family protein
MKKLVLLFIFLFYTIAFGEISVTPFGAAGVVSGSSFLIDYNGKSAIVDCGLFYGNDGDNYKMPSLLTKASFLILTHAHLDHIGRIPLLIHSGFKGKIYSTKPTKQFTLDSFKNGSGFDLIKLKWAWDKNMSKRNVIHWQTECIKNIKNVVWSDDKYTLGEIRNRTGIKFSLCKICLNIDAEKISDLFIDVPYNKEIKLSDKYSFSFINAAHIPGSASIFFKIDDIKIVFSGDLGSGYSKLTGQNLPIAKADYIFMEATNASSEGKILKEEAYNSFHSDVIRALNEKKIVWINALAFNRTQKVLYELKVMQDKGELSKDIEIYSASYGANKVSRLYEREARENKSEWFVEEIYKKKSILPVNLYFKAPSVFFKPFIMLSASGDESMTRKFINTFLKNGNRASIMAVNYLNSENPIELLYNEKNSMLAVKKYGVFSDHPDAHGLLEWLSNQDINSNIYIVHYEHKDFLKIKSFFAKNNIKINGTKFQERILIKQ